MQSFSNLVDDAWLSHGVETPDALAEHERVLESLGLSPADVNRVLAGEPVDASSVHRPFSFFKTADGRRTDV